MAKIHYEVLESTLRKVHFFKYISWGNGYEKEPTLGYFHQWGLSFTEFDNGIGNSTIGIIEDKDGQIHEVPPSKIQFKDW